MMVLGVTVFRLKIIVDTCNRNDNYQQKNLKSDPPAVTTAIQKPGNIPLVRRFLTITGLSAMSGSLLSNLHTSLRIQGS